MAFVCVQARLREVLTRCSNRLIFIANVIDTTGVFESVIRRSNSPLCLSRVVSLMMGSALRHAVVDEVNYLLQSRPLLQI